jgi:hypothetical protein
MSKTRNEVRATKSAQPDGITRSRPEDYDGHTEFARLSPGQRLRWMEGALRFIQQAKRARKIG